MEKLEFECSFRQVSEWTGLVLEKGEKIKSGHYTHCVLPVKGYGLSKWAIVAYVDVEYEKYRAENYTDEQIVQGCLNFLNKPPTRRHRKSRYGSLEPNWFKVLEDKKLISVCFITDQKKNKNFWWKGWKGLR